MTKPIDIDELQRIADAATRGPWRWYGNTKMNEVYLATTHSGRRFVMDFVRWGMRGAQPRFQIDHQMRPIGELGADEYPLGPKFEASHRRQFSGIGHPDAEHIAASSPDVVLAMIARIRELEATLSMMLKSAHPHPVGRPTMTAAWAQARAVLAKPLEVP